MVEIRREVARAIALFASRDESQQDLIASGGLQQLLAFVRSPDAKCQRYGALGIGNLALVLGNHVDIIEHASGS